MSIKKGDYIYYVDKHGDTIPARVMRLMRVFCIINDGERDYRVKIKSCEVQCNEY